MYALVDIAGFQYKVQKDQQLCVNRLAGEAGDNVQFDNVLLIDNAGSVAVGAPAISGAAVTAKIVEHLKGDKVIVFKKKRRKGYRKKNGHRQFLTSIKIGTIMESGAKAAKKEEKKAAPKAAPAPKAVAPKAAPAPKAAKSTKDDLKKVEGIGPKIEETLHAAGVMTFGDLAGTTPEKISEIITDVRGKHVPNSWPKQAKMADDGKWDELKKWQDEHDGGIE